MEKYYYSFTTKNDTLKEKIKVKFYNFTAWFYNNKELAIILIPIISTTGIALIKTTGKVCRGVINNRNLRKEEIIKNLYCYDRSLGHYWKLKRELSNSEWVKIDNRKKNGERLADILSEMNVLK